MSMTVLAIAATHAAPVIIAGFITRAYGPVSIATLVMMLVGYFTGNPAFVAFDLVAVAIGSVIAFNAVESGESTGES